MKIPLGTGLALAAVLLTTGCTGSAQNLDPAADDPGASDNRTNAAQANKNACDLGSDALLGSLTDVSTKGPARAAWVFKGDGGWYVAAPLGANGTLSTTVGLWATNDDPTGTEFDGTLYALNGDASSGSSSSTDAPSAFSADSTAGKQALTCAKNTDD